MSEVKKPVWIAFPLIPWGSIGWRMGAGEDYWHAWLAWFNGLSAEERAAYQQTWPEPEMWQGFYAFVESGTLPPWFLQQRCLIVEAAIPPTPDENVITGYHRVLWLIRHHFTRVRHDECGEDESIAEVYVAPDGVEWRLSASATQGGLHLTRVIR